MKDTRFKWPKIFYVILRGGALRFPFGIILNTFHAVTVHE